MGGHTRGEGRQRSIRLGNNNKVARLGPNPILATDQVLPELSGGGQTHHDLVLPAIGADFGDLDEPAAVVLLHVQVEPL